MNEVMQDKMEMQDEELYALLDRAFETERLCVSEDLIQKTLKRAAAEKDGNVVPFERAAKKRNMLLSYAGVAAAAVFVLVLGVSAFGDGLWNGGVKKEAVYDKAQRNIQSDATTESAGNCAPMTEDGEIYYSSTADSVNEDMDVMSDRAGVALELAVSEEKEEKTAGLQSFGVTLPEQLSEALSRVGYKPKGSEAEVWEFVESRGRWDGEIAEALETEGTLETKLPKKGSYNYNLMRTDGEEKEICFGEPLELIVRIETEQGTLWSLFGESVYLYLE